MLSGSKLRCWLWIRDVEVERRPWAIHASSLYNVLRSRVLPCYVALPATTFTPANKRSRACDRAHRDYCTRSWSHGRDWYNARQNLLPSRTTPLQKNRLGSRGPVSTGTIPTAAPAPPSAPTRTSPQLVATPHPITQRALPWEQTVAPRLLWLP